MYKEEIFKAVNSVYPEITEADIAAAPSGMADFCAPCFKVAKTYRKNPAELAKDGAEKITLDGFTVTSAGGYINFTVNREKLARDVLSGEEAFVSPLKGKTFVIDYASVNIAKPLHIGHLPSTAIGGSLMRIYKYLGAKPVGINHIGDYGTQFGNLIAACKLWGDEKELDKGGLEYLLKLYVRFHNEAEDNPALKEEGRACFKLIEEGEPHAVALFEKFKKITIEYSKKIFARLGVDFDSWAGESFYNDKMTPVIDELKAKKLAEISEGALVVPLGEGMPPALVCRSDGASLYLTRDLAAAKYRKTEYDFDKCLYVVATQQNLHFRQLFKTIELMGYDWANDMEHVSFGMVSIEGSGSLSTRKGNVLRLEEVLDLAVKKASEIIAERNPGLENREEIAESVGVGAVIFGMLHDSRIKDVVFSLEKALNFDGETAPYIQYTYARCRSVLKKAKAEAEADFSCLTDGDSAETLKLIGSFNDVVESVAEKYEPSLIARYLVNLSRAYNRFYVANRIITDNPSVTAARLVLTERTAETLQTGLNLILVNAPEKM